MERSVYGEVCLWRSHIMGRPLYAEVEWLERSVSRGFPRRLCRCDGRYIRVTRCLHSCSLHTGNFVLHPVFSPSMAAYRYEIGINLLYFHLLTIATRITISIHSNRIRLAVCGIGNGNNLERNKHVKRFVNTFNKAHIWKSHRSTRNLFAVVVSVIATQRQND